AESRRPRRLRVIHRHYCERVLLARVERIDHQTVHDILHDVVEVRLVVEAVGDDRDTVCATTRRARRKNGGYRRGARRRRREKTESGADELTNDSHETSLERYGVTWARAPGCRIAFFRRIGHRRIALPIRDQPRRARRNRIE